MSWTPPGDAVVTDEKKGWTPPSDAVPAESLKKKEVSEPSEFTAPIPEGGIGPPFQNASVKSSSGGPSTSSDPSAPTTPLLPQGEGQAAPYDWNSIKIEEQKPLPTAATTLTAKPEQASTGSATNPTPGHKPEMKMIAVDPEKKLSEQKVKENPAFETIQNAFLENPDMFSDVGSGGGVGKDRRIKFYKLAYERSRDDSKEFNAQEFEQLVNESEKKFEDANELFNYNKLLAKEPDNINYRYAVGFRQMNLGRTQEAVDNFKRIIEKNPKYSPAYSAMAYLYSDKDQHDVALTFMDDAIENNPNDPALYSNRAIIKQRAGDIEGAVKDLDYAKTQTNNKSIQLEIEKQYADIFQRLYHNRDSKSEKYIAMIKGEWNPEDAAVDQEFFKERWNEHNRNAVNLKKELIAENKKLSEDKIKAGDFSEFTGANNLTVPEEMRGYIAAKAQREFMEAILVDPKQLGVAGFIMNPVGFIARGGIEGIAEGGKEILKGIDKIDEFDPSSLSEDKVDHTKVIKGTMEGAIAGLMASTPAGWAFTGASAGLKELPYGEVVEKLAFAPISTMFESDSDAAVIGDLIIGGVLLHAANKGMNGSKEVLEKAKNKEAFTPEDVKVYEEAVKVMPEEEIKALIPSPSPEKGRRESSQRPTAEARKEGFVKRQMEALDEMSPEISKEQYEAYFGDLYDRRAKEFRYSPREDLSPKESEVEKKFGDLVKGDFEAAKEKYLAEHENYLSVDAAKDLSEDYVADKTLTSAVQKPASAFIGKLFDEEVERMDIDKVVFTAGGTGAGKTIGVEAKPGELVVDGNLANEAKAKSQIDKALDSGKKVEIEYIYRDPVKAFVDGVIPRYVEPGKEGRPVRAPIHLKTHIESLKTIQKLADQYKGNENVKISYFDNSFERGNLKQITLNDVQKLTLDEGELKKQLNNELEKARNEGRISEEQYQELSAGVVREGAVVDNAKPRSDTEPEGADENTSGGFPEFGTEKATEEGGSPAGERLGREKPAAEKEKRTGAKDDSKNGRLDKGKKAQRVRAGNRVAKVHRQIKNPRAIEALKIEPATPREAVLQYFINKGQLHPSAIEKLYGGGDKKPMGEMRARIGLLSKEHGLGIDEIAHKLWEERTDERLTTADFREAVEGVINDHKGTGKMIDEILQEERVAKEEFDMYNASHEPEIIDEAADWFDSLTDEQKQEMHDAETPPALIPGPSPEKGEGGTPFSEQASTKKAYENIAGLKPRSQEGRVPVEPIVGGAVKDISQIIFDVSKDTKQRLFMGSAGSGRRSSLGTYNPGNSAVKIKFNGDLDTTAHELGHSIDDLFGVLGELQKTPNLPVEMELNKFSPFGSTPPAGHPNPRLYTYAEGFAEFLRAYIVNPEKTKTEAPNLFKLYEARVSPEYRKAVDGFSKDIRTWAGSSGRDMVLSNVEWKPEEKKGIVGQILSKSEPNNMFGITWADKLAANFVNPMRAFDKATEYAKGLKGIDEVLPENDPILQARVLLGVDGKVSELLDTGMIDAKMNVLRDKDGNVKNLNWLLEPIDNTDISTIEKGLKDAVSYMIAEKTVEKGKQFERESIISGIGGGIFKDVDVAKKALDEFNAMDPKKLEAIKEAASRYREMADDVLKYMVDKGRLSKENYDKIKADNTQYVAMQRVIEAEPGREIEVYKSGGGSVGSKTEVIHQFKGSTKKIQNPYTSLLDLIYKGVKESDRNETLLAFRNLLVPERTDMYDGTPVRLADIGTRAKAAEKETITIFVDGKPEYWKFQTDVYKALKGLDGDAYKLPAVVTALPSILRWTVTHFPVFAARNVVRDFQDRIIKSNENSYKNLYGIKDFIGDKEHWNEVARAGGLNAGFYMKDRVHYYGLLETAMKDMAKNKKSILVDPARLKAGWDGYKSILQKSETINRVAEYRAGFRNGKAKGMDDYNAKLYAALKSRDLLDFALMGHWMKVVNQMIPFSNAAIQGTRSALVRAKENPLGFTGRMVAFSVIPSIGLWLLNNKDEESRKQYNELPDYQRDLFYNFKAGPDKWVSIPKPYELSLMGSAVDRGMSFYAGDKEAFKGYGGTVAKSLFPFDEASFAGGFQAIIEASTNYDYFRDKNIVAPHEEALDLALRDTERASRLGKAVQDMSGIDARKIDHFIKGTFSYYGKTATELSDIGKQGDKNPFTLGDVGFFRQTPAYNGKSAQEFMEISKKGGLTSTLPYKEFTNRVKKYFAAVSEEDRERMAKELNDYAQKNLPKMRKALEEKVKQASPHP